MAAHGVLRIGELSRRSGVSPELLRAWERRYGLLEPTRSPGGLRLYSEQDMARVQAMKRHLAQGVAAAEAADLARREPRPESEAATFDPAAAREELGSALESFDETAAQLVYDRLLGLATVDALLGEVVLPYLHDLGERWAAGEISVEQEHFASNVLRGRLLGLGRDWGRGFGPLALLACAPGERHDLGLISFGLALRARGWRIAYLGPDTPMESIAGAAGSLEPDVVVVCAVDAERLKSVADDVESLAARHRVALGGSGAAGLSDSLAALVLDDDPLAAADRVTAQVASRAERPATSRSASGGTSTRT